MRRHLKTVTLFVLMLSIAACEGGEQPVRSSELGSLVLQSADMGPGFFQFDVGRQELLDYRLGPRRDPKRFGRQDGWKARYRREDTSVRTGPLLVESRVDLFGDEDGAEQDLTAYREEFQAFIRDAPTRAQLIRAPTIGDGTAAMTLMRGRGSRTVRYFRIAWRERALTGYVSVSGFEGGLSLTDALRLARQQQARMHAATQ